MSDDKILSKREFFKLLAEGGGPAAPSPGKANWNAIYAELKKTKIPLTIKIIQEHYVKGAVTRYRTKNKLQEWAAAGKCKQIWHKGKYWFFFGRAPRKRKKKEEEEAPPSESKTN